ncbi:hypothetical protein CC79DRAFT_1345502 [Sarocladium strictum]
MRAKKGASVWLPSSDTSSVEKRTLLYFICGNPGLIEYYRDFLTHLRHLLDTANSSGTAYDIYGCNLPGFSDSDHEKPFSAENPPWNLPGVMGKMYEDVKTRGEGYGEVILMGHSVGTFIAVEMFHRYLREDAGGVKLRHGFLLFPTVTHIALSPNGKRFTFLMRWLPLLEKYAHIPARMILSLVPYMLLEGFISNILGFAPSAAKTTAGWLKSRDGVYQTLYLASDEMKVIAGEERWGSEIWEVEDAPSTKMSGGESGGKAGLPRFFMLYGKKDHWVDENLRDDFVGRMGRLRGEGRRVPRIEVDGKGLRHDFCTMEDSSFEVAEKVNAWVAEIEAAKRR